MSPSHRVGRRLVVVIVVVVTIVLLVRRQGHARIPIAIAPCVVVAVVFVAAGIGPTRGNISTTLTRNLLVLPSIRGSLSLDSSSEDCSTPGRRSSSFSSSLLTHAGPGVAPSPGLRPVATPRAILTLLRSR